MYSKEEAYEQISELVNRFEEQYRSYTRMDYNETQTRRDFIDPFFKALGWDVDNSQGYAEAYREVIHEDKIRVVGALKAPDYSFKLPGGKRLFFLEAKKPSVLVREEMPPAYQLRRYGWSAKMPISVITDFEEFAIYDCTKKPSSGDRASVGRIRYLTFRDYLKEFDFLWETFSKERVLKGGFDKYIQSDTLKKGTATVDKEFLRSLDTWRTRLAVVISKQNQSLDEDELNFVVQHFLDRVIFLRIAEDRKAEEYGTLKTAVKKGDAYSSLFDVFLRADAKYNSGLFDFRKDKLSEGLVVDGKTVKSIIDELYFPVSPYEFSVLSVEILGSAYEQFLGKQIRLDKSHRVKIEEKPEVRKAGGVYYTPEYVVEYIVRKTLGNLVNGKTPKDVAKLKILDPACGSGSFLLGAYQFLLHWHQEYYKPQFEKLTHQATSQKYTRKQRLEAVKERSKLPLTPEGNLTAKIKKEILLNNIYGVDLDANAVEVTKLSLLLKCLEGETQSSMNAALSFGDRILPTLDNNIRSGNSLIETNFFDDLVEIEAPKKVKPFSWERAFPHVVSKKGFDIVIGNPPYVMVQTMESQEIFDYTLRNYQSAKYKIDTYQLFIERAILLLRPGGMMGYITPNTFLKNVHSEPLRRLLTGNVTINEIVLYQYPVFADASVDTCTIILSKGVPGGDHKVKVINSTQPMELTDGGMISQKSFAKNVRCDFNLSANDSDVEVLAQITRNSVSLQHYCDAYFGIQTYYRDSFVAPTAKSGLYRPVVDGANIEPYFLKPPTEFVKFVPDAIKSGGNEKVYLQDRIGIRQIGLTPIATILPAGIFTLNTIYNVYKKAKDGPSLLFLLGVVCSNVTKFYWRKTQSDEKRTFPKIKKEAILSIPVPKCSDALQKQVADSVAKVLKLKSDLRTNRVSSKVDQLATELGYHERKVNELLYKTFQLSPEEIGIIESGQVWQTTTIT